MGLMNVDGLGAAGQMVLVVMCLWPLKTHLFLSRNIEACRNICRNISKHILFFSFINLFLSSCLLSSFQSTSFG